jgi:hypothetical protein
MFIFYVAGQANFLLLEKKLMMKYFGFISLLLWLSSCSKDDKNLISKNRLGDLTSNTKITQIDNILANDSVELIYALDAFGKAIPNTIKEIEVYDTSGHQILLIKPSAGMDTLSTIRNIRILSEKYKTSEGLGIGSTFAEVKKYHDVSNIQSSLKSVIITLKDLNAFISFDREVLPGDVRFDMDAEITPIMIPDDAKINRFWINFDADAHEKN